MTVLDRGRWQWESATAGAIAGFATVACLHPLDVVRTRFQVNDGRVSNLPLYKNTGHAILTIARTEGLRGLYAGFYPAVLGSTISWGLYFFFYSRAKQRYLRGSEEQMLSPGLHLLSAAEAGSLVSHGAIQFTVYEELRRLAIHIKCKEGKKNIANEDKLNSVDYAMLGASSKVAAILLTYPYQVIRARLQQRPNSDGIPKYMDSWHVVKETIRFEGIRGFYRGITSNLLKNVPAASITFVVYENVLHLFRLSRRRHN
ncbi:folate transporter 1 isoform X3 [Tasmannia lanceolata]|uniref:folate transporter 1 isoform X3 n=1 Tax=Tasmannia lanceolata TaxID=3420 RepID=UPI0040628773